MTIYKTYIDTLPSSPVTNKCIVLDLDETLIHTFDTMESFAKLKIISDPSLLDIRLRTYILSLEEVEETEKSIKIDMWGTARPHYQEFLQFCFSYFSKVIVWSAGRSGYVYDAVNYLFRNLRQPDIIFTWDHCKKTLDKHENLIGLEKPLEKLYSQYPQLCNEKNTLIVDNNHSTFLKVNPNNGILIPNYEPIPTIASLRRDDFNLLELRTWLLKPEVINSVDVGSLDKSHIFSQPAKHGQS